MVAVQQVVLVGAAMQRHNRYMVPTFGRVTRLLARTHLSHRYLAHGKSLGFDFDPSAGLSAIGPRQFFRGITTRYFFQFLFDGPRAPYIALHISRECSHFSIYRKRCSCCRSYPGWRGYIPLPLPIHMGLTYI